MGCFPLVVHWDADGKKDLVVGRADGLIKLYLNTNTNAVPLFDGGTILQYGEIGSKIDISVGARSTPAIVDWNNDGKKDLVAGALDGRVRLYLNEGSHTEPDFRTVQFVQDGASDLSVNDSRSSPQVLDLDDDGKKDIIAGNTSGNLILYRNTGTDASPAFSGFEYVESDGNILDLSGTERSRPTLCDWTGDGEIDVLIGYGDGRVHLFQGVDYSSVPQNGDSPPVVSRLLAAYPNPFNPSVTVPFELAAPERLRMSVYDTAGRIVATLIRGEPYPAGPDQITWDGRGENGRLLPSGTYLVRLTGGGIEESAKVILLR